MRVGGVVPVETDRGKWQKQNGIQQEGCEGEEMRRQEWEKNRRPMKGVTVRRGQIDK